MATIRQTMMYARSRYLFEVEVGKNLLNCGISGSSVPETLYEKQVLEGLKCSLGLPCSLLPGSVQSGLEVSSIQHRTTNSGLGV